MKATKKPVTIEFFTFEEFVEIGRNTEGVHIVEGMPWSFMFHNVPITHENNECYLIPTLEGTMRFTTDDVLIIGVKGEVYPCKKDIFEMTYNTAPEIPAESWLLYFQDQEGKPVLGFKANGDIVIKGNPPINDREVVDALRECFNLQSYGAEPEGD